MIKKHLSLEKWYLCFLFLFFCHGGRIPVLATKENFSFRLYIDSQMTFKNHYIFDKGKENFEAKLPQKLNFLHSFLCGANSPPGDFSFYLWIDYSPIHLLNL